MRALLIIGWLIACLLAVAFLCHRKGFARPAVAAALSAIGAALYLYLRIR